MDGQWLSNLGAGAPLGEQFIGHYILGPDDRITMWSRNFGKSSYLQLWKCCIKLGRKVQFWKKKSIGHSSFHVGDIITMWALEFSKSSYNYQLSNLEHKYTWRGVYWALILWCC